VEPESRQHGDEYRMSKQRHVMVLFSYARCRARHRQRDIFGAARAAGLPCKPRRAALGSKCCRDLGERRAGTSPRAKCSAGRVSSEGGSDSEGKMRKVEVVSGPDVKFEGYFKLTETRLRFVKNDGSMSREVSRLNLDRPDASAVLLYNPGEDSLVLVRQFRYSVYVGGDGGWMTEIVAGTLAPGDDPEQAAVREVMEETGYKVEHLRHLCTFYPSPGGCSEKCFLYAAVVDEAMKTGPGGGAPGEEEDIEVVDMPASAALEMLERGEFNDAKTIIALQWFEATRGEWP